MNHRVNGTRRSAQERGRFLHGEVVAALPVHIGKRHNLITSLRPLLLRRRHIGVGIAQISCGTSWTALGQVDEERVVADVVGHDDEVRSLIEEFF